MTHRIKRSYIILLLIIITAASLRLYRLPDMASFDFDQEYAANFAYSVIKVFPVQLIGQESSLPGLYLGPLYFYYLTPFFALFNLHPIGGFVGTILLGTITIVVYYLVGRSLFGETAGLIVAFMRGILFSKFDIAWSMVPSFSAGLSVLITWFCFYKYWHGDLRWLPLLGLVFGAYTSMHPILFPFYFVFLILVIIKKKLPDLKTTLLSIVALIIPNLMLIVFEILHNFLEVKKLFTLISQPRSNFGWSESLSYLQVSANNLYQILSFNYLPQWLIVGSFLIILFLLARKKIGFWKDNFHKVTLFVTFLVFITYYTVFPFHVPEYYLRPLTTLMLLYTGALLSLLIKSRSKLILALILINIAIVNLNQLVARWNNPSLTTLSHKDYIVKEILKRQPQNQDFYVSYIKNPGWNFGFDYLFKIYGHQSGKEIKQPIYTIVIPKSLSPDAIDVSSGNIGLILPDKMR